MSDFSVEKIKLNSAGIQSMMKSTECIAMLEDFARIRAAQLGVGYESDVYVGKTRANAAIYTGTQEAADDNYDNNTLLKGIGI